MPEKIGKDVIGRKTKLRTQAKKKISAIELQKEIRTIASYLRENPREIDEKTKEELRKLIPIIEKANPDFTEKARKLTSSIGTVADIAQLLTFLSGVPSLPVLFQTFRIGNGLLNISSMKSRRFSYRKKKPYRKKKTKIPKSVAYI